MTATIQTTFRGTPADDDLDRLVREEAAKLERFFGGITSCRVFIDKPHRHRRQGAQYQVRIVLAVPGKEIVTNSAPTEHAALVASEADRARKRDELDAANRYSEVAVRDAFRKAGRQLQDYVRELSGSVKLHETAPTGHVRVLMPDFGFLRSSDGRDIYFHQHSVLNDAFKHLHVGSLVRFVEEAGEKGPQASTVIAIDRS